MARPKPDKSALLSALAAHVLKHGLNTASLRPMAAAAGTSDRMLIYHFGNKDNLIGELLQYLAGQMAAELDALLPPKPVATEAELVSGIVDAMRSPAFQPYTRVWLDIVSASGQNQQPHAAAGHGIVTGFLSWLALRHPSGEKGAAFALTLIEGILVMDSVGQKATADAAIATLQARENQ